MQGPDFSCVSYVDTTLIKKNKEFPKKKDGRQKKNGMNIWTNKK